MITARISCNVLRRARRDIPDRLRDRRARRRFGSRKKTRSNNDPAAAELGSVQRPGGCALLRARARRRATTVHAGCGAAGFGPPDLASAYKLDTALTPDATIAIVDAYDYANAESDLATYRTQVRPAGVHHGERLLQDRQPERRDVAAAAARAVGRRLDGRGRARSRHGQRRVPEVQAAPRRGPGRPGRRPLHRERRRREPGRRPSSATAGAAPSRATPRATRPTSTTPGIADLRRVRRQRQHRRASPDYPSTSAYVTAVGGTSLVKASNTRGWTEGAWSDGGSSCSIAHREAELPDAARPCSKRAAADVVGGRRSEHRPRGLQRGRTAAGSSSAARARRRRSSPACTRSTASAARARRTRTQHARDFFDVTTGKNGTCGTLLCNAGAGWDGPTGIGTPNGAARRSAAAGHGRRRLHAGVQRQDAAVTTAAAARAARAPSRRAAARPARACRRGGGGSTCAHPICSTGGELDPTCDTCAGEVCAQDSYCCTTAWDSICVGEVGSVCGETLQRRRRRRLGQRRRRLRPARTRICSTGTKLKTSCDSLRGATSARRTRTAATPSGTRSACREVGSICGESCN